VTPPTYTRDFLSIRRSITTDLFGCSRNQTTNDIFFILLLKNLKKTPFVTFSLYPNTKPNKSCRPHPSNSGVRTTRSSSKSSSIYERAPVPSLWCSIRWSRAGPRSSPSSSGGPRYVYVYMFFRSSSSLPPAHSGS